MKKLIALLLAAVMVMALMTACGAKTSAPAETAAPETEAAKDLAALVSADTNDLYLFADGTLSYTTGESLAVDGGFCIRRL